MLKESFKGKEVLIFGLGLNDGGLGMTEFFVKQGATVTVTDSKTAEQLESTLAKLVKYKNKIAYHLGGQLKDDFLENDIIIQNPGVRPDNEYIQLAKSAGKRIEMEMSLFCKLAPCKIVGITGTRGKSTTTTLVYKLLQEHFGKKVILAGNIGKSAIRQLRKLTKDHIVVLELSSFQLHTMGLAKISPQVALITNIYPDHLNWHTDMQDYIDAKKNILKYQMSTDWVVLNTDNPAVVAMIPDVKGRLVKFSSVDPKADYYLDKDSTIHERGKALVNIQKSRLKGVHNYYNIVASVALARIFGVKESSIIKVISTFKGVEGRQQYLSTIKGVKYYNDTTATSAEAMLAMLDRFGSDYKKKLIVISGGVDKGLDYTKVKYGLESYVKTLVLLEGTASDKILATLDRSKVDIKGKFSGFEEAVYTARNSASKGDMIVLCPAAASFNMFKNEFDRGKQFNAIVRKVKASA